MTIDRYIPWPTLRTHRVKPFGLIGLLALLIVLIADRAATASIRMDGSEFQGGSNVATTSGQSKQGSAKKQSASGFPAKIVMTVGQPVMARGVVPESETSTPAFKIGLGYEYNVWGTADLKCACPCFGDPVCDGSPTDLADVVSVIGVAIRGFPPTHEGSCPLVSADVNCDTVVNIMDVVLMINVAFRAANAATQFCHPCQ